MNSKIGNLTRRRPEFEPSLAGAEAAQLMQVERCRRVQNPWQADDVKNQFLSLFQYNAFEWLLTISGERNAKRTNGKNFNTSDRFWRVANGLTL